MSYILGQSGMVLGKNEYLKQCMVGYILGQSGMVLGKNEYLKQCMVG